MMLQLVWKWKRPLRPATGKEPLPSLTSQRVIYGTARPGAHVQKGQSAHGGVTRCLMTSSWEATCCKMIHHTNNSSCFTTFKPYLLLMSDSHTRNANVSLLHETSPSKPRHKQARTPPQLPLQILCPLETQAVLHQVASSSNLGAQVK